MSVLSNVSGEFIENVVASEGGTTEKGVVYGPSVKAFWCDADGKIEGVIHMRNLPASFVGVSRGQKFTVETKRDYVRKSGAVLQIPHKEGNFPVKYLHILSLDFKSEGKDFDIVFHD